MNSFLRGLGGLVSLGPTISGTIIHGSQQFAHQYRDQRSERALGSLRMDTQKIGNDMTRTVSKIRAEWDQ